MRSRCGEAPRWRTSPIVPRCSPRPRGSTSSGSGPRKIVVEGLLAGGQDARAVGEVETLISQQPLRESLWALLMLGLYRDGRQADALNAFQRAREILADQLGIDSSAELARLQERILQHDPGLDLRGEPLRGYRLLEKLGDGPDGVVFRGSTTSSDVAVKVFREGVAADPAFVRRFEPDAQLAAALEHPHIVPTHDAWREPGRAYLVSRYLRGGSLRALDARGDLLDRDRSMRLVEQIASALAFAHRQGVTHGHVSASNVLFDAEGNAYLGDFVVRSAPASASGDDLRKFARLTRELLGTRDARTARGLVERAEDGNTRSKPVSSPTRSGSCSSRQRSPRWCGPTPATRTRVCVPSPKPTRATSSGGGR